MADATIETQRLRLSPFRRDEAAALHALWTQPEVRRYLWDDQIISRDRTTQILLENEELFARRGFGLWSIRRKTTSALRGFGGFWHFREPPELELLLGLGAENWSQGYATEAGLALIRHGFEVLGLAEIRGSTDAPNDRSIRLMRRLGMQYQRRATIGGLDTVFFRAERTGWNLDPTGAPAT